MATYETCISLLVMGGAIALTALCRRLARQSLRRRPSLSSFAQELTGAFQIGACTSELCLLADLPPKPHVALALTYLFTAFHGILLPSSVNNPASSFQLLISHKSKSTVKAWGIQTSGQFLGAALAHIGIRAVWALGTVPAHSRALRAACSGPIQTTVANAFILELVFSFVFHLAALKSESMDPKARVHLLALLITFLVYQGGHLTGAIFNPALAFCLHLSCFLDKFWNYTLVYWVAPCIGSVLVAVVWDEIVPHIHSHFNSQGT
ncbi:aquaporin-11 isoform X1 [Paroedura picta]|uniref:aquaporin-11 isoform X1 n=1 Tax=Paroedura picta TaxID=143630 RepID=UPI0040568212